MLNPVQHDFHARHTVTLNLPALNLIHGFQGLRDDGRRRSGYCYQLGNHGPRRFSKCANGTLQRWCLCLFFLCAFTHFT